MYPTFALFNRTLKQKMTSEWEFLKPWHTVLQGRPTHCKITDLHISFRCPGHFGYATDVYVKIPVDAESRRNVAWLQQIREAMELFTVLSVVNNRAFREFFSSQHRSSPCHPVWWLMPTGILAPDDPAASQSSVSWGAFLGFPNDTSSYSPEFLAALEKLETIGLEEASNMVFRAHFEVGWRCELPGSYHRGWQTLSRCPRTVSTFLDGFREMFHTRASPVVQMQLSRGEAEVMEVLPPQRQPGTPFTFERCMISNTTLAMRTGFVELLAAMVGVATKTFSLNLRRATMDTLQFTMNVGLLLSSIVCDQSLVVVRTESREEFPHLPHRVQLSKLEFSCSSVSNVVFSASCSAVAAYSSSTDLSKFNINELNAERWLWLIYAICCGSSSVTVQAVNITRGKLANVDFSAIEAVLRTSYPLPVMNQGKALTPQYGFVDISAGAEFQLGRSRNDDNTIHVVSGTVRCRALYSPAGDVDNVEMVVPGYGLCKARLTNSIRFTPDSEKSELATRRVSGSLGLQYVKVGNTALLLDLLALVTRGLRSLTLVEDADNLNQLDLTELSVACPDLQTLCTSNFTVVVAAHDESLRRWSIEKMEIDATRSISDLTSCLTDSSLRMSRELVKLEVRLLSPESQCLDDGEISQLKAHDGEFLPIVKEKFPLQSKTAMISAVTSPSGFYEAHRMDAHVLSLIFVFASTPAQRSVPVRVCGRT